MTETLKLSTDVLVVGGGIAGCFAAIAARKGGAEVILVDKGYVSSSGQSPYAGTFIYFDPEKDNMEEWLNKIRFNGDYVVNLDFTEQTLARSKECVDDMLSYGAKFRCNPDGSLQIRGEGEQGVNATFPECLSFPLALRKQAIKEGATIMDRIMVFDLIVEDGKACGVLGMTVTDGTPVVITAKSVIVSTGASALKPPGWPISNLTGDGDMMAYRAGVAITGKEFIDAHSTSSKTPSALSMNPFKAPPGGPPDGGKKGGPGGDKKGGPPGGGGRPQMRNAYGDPVQMVPNLNLSVEFEIHAGRGPITMPPGMGPPGFSDKGEMISCASHGMACHKTEGIWPADTDCSTSLPGLYGAGDSLGTMMSGAAYANIGLALGGSAVTGRVAGESASAYAKSVPAVDPCADSIAKKFAEFYAPLERKGGFTPDWLINYLQNITMPYFVLIVKEESRLLHVLEQVRYAKAHIVPKLYVKDAHGLRVAIEAKNMVDNMEIKLLSAMARKESRGTHFREDYPDRDESNFGAWITVRDVDGTPTVEKHDMPDAWKWKEGEPRLVTFPSQF